MGGLNRRWLKDPQPLEYKDNPEHGLRLILTFEPQTSFLVPVDRCVGLARNGIAAGIEGAAAAASAAAASGGALPPPPPAVDAATVGHYRRQALRFLHVCLASMLNLRVREVEADAMEVEAARGALTQRASQGLGDAAAAAVAGAGGDAPVAAGAGAEGGAAGPGAGPAAAAAVAAAAGGLGPGGDLSVIAGGMETLLKVVTGELSPPQVVMAMNKVGGKGGRMGLSCACMRRMRRYAMQCTLLPHVPLARSLPRLTLQPRRFRPAPPCLPIRTPAAAGLRREDQDAGGGGALGAGAAAGRSHGRSGRRGAGRSRPPLCAQRQPALRHAVRGGHSPAPARAPHGPYCCTGPQPAEAPAVARGGPRAVGGAGLAGAGRGWQRDRERRRGVAAAAWVEGAGLPAVPGRVG